MEIFVACYATGIEDSVELFYQRQPLYNAISNAGRVVCYEILDNFRRHPG